MKKKSKKGKSAYARFWDGGETSLLIRKSRHGTILHGWLLTPLWGEEPGVENIGRDDILVDHVVPRVRG